MLRGTILVLIGIFGVLSIPDARPATPEDCITDLLTRLQRPARQRVFHQNGRPITSDEVLAHFVPKGFIENLPRRGARIEIGAAAKPFCSDCIQVDKYRSFVEMYPDIAKDPARLQNFLETTRMPREEFFTPWAAAEKEKLGLKPGGGAIADARSLPLENGSADLVFLKDFVWYKEMNAEKTRFIEDTLKEFHRVLSPEGTVLVVGRGFDPQAYETHVRIAKALGFEVEFAPVHRIQVETLIRGTRELDFGGIILRKKR